MIKNKILKRNYFIKKDYATYCGKCGKKQMQDSHNLKKHASLCGFPVDVEPRVFENGNEYAYAFRISEDGESLQFYVFSYELEFMPGFRDKYRGGVYKKVFTAIFKRNSRQVLEKGMYNVDAWMKMFIDQKGIPSLSADKDIDIFREFFTDVLAFESYGAFLDIYRNKGYGHKKLITDERASSVLNKSSDFFDKHPSFVFITGRMEYIDSCKLLHIFISNDADMKNIFMEALIGEEYAYSLDDSGEIIPFLLHADTFPVINMIPDTVLHEFNETYPKFMVKEYLAAGGTNIAIPLFSSNYDKSLELLYKSGIVEFSDNFFALKKNNNLVLYKNNIKEIFGLPVKTLKRIASKKVTMEKDFLAKVKAIYEYDSRYLEFDSYSDAAIMFMQYTNITKSNEYVSDRRYSSRIINRWDKDMLFKTMKYLQKTKPFDGIEENNVWETYIDYISMQNQIGECVKGDYPKNLLEAHDDAAEMLYAKMHEKIEREFINVVNSELYQYFTTGYGEEKKEFEEEKYAIYAPHKPYDLVRESAQMNNCVKGYVDKVSGMQSIVLFLREKEYPSKSVCTIEVKPPRTLVQLKAYGNSKASEEIRNFVKKWAKIKGIKLLTRDVSN